jgi:hypothetical protein
VFIPWGRGKGRKERREGRRAMIISMAVFYSRCGIADEIQTTPSTTQ